MLHGPDKNNLGKTTQLVRGDMEIDPDFLTLGSLFWLHFVA